MKKVGLILMLSIISLYALPNMPFNFEGKFNYNMISNAEGIKDQDATSMNIGINAILPVFMGLKARLNLIGFEIYTLKDFPVKGEDYSTNYFRFNLFNGGDLMYFFPLPPFNPYVFAGLGMENVSPEEGDSYTSYGLKIGLGAGYSLPMLSFFLEAGYEMFDSGLEFSETEGKILIGAGVRF